MMKLTVSMKSSMRLKAGTSSTLLKYAPSCHMTHTMPVKMTSATKSSRKDLLQRVKLCLPVKGLSLCPCP